MVSGTELSGVISAKIPRITDHRGSLTKIFASGAPALRDVSMRPRQILHSGTSKRLTLRGLHAQVAPNTEAKIIVPMTGCMYWVVVDLRRGSDNFGRWQGFELSPDAVNWLYVPRGFAHGCLSRSEDVNLVILADQDFSPGHGIGISWNDRDIAIDWGLGGDQPLLSAEHAAYGSFAEFRRQHGAL